MPAAQNLPDPDALEAVDNGQRLAAAMAREVMAIGEPPMPESERLVGEIDRRLSDLEGALVALGQLIDPERALASAVFGAVGSCAVDMRRQVKPLREAVRDMEGRS